MEIIFESNINKTYQVVEGGLLGDEFNETLDSATIILDNIRLEDRLFAEPYQYAKVSNKDFTNFYIINSIVENPKNIVENIYTYTIELMSPLKLFEKFQCPNLQITHSLVSGQKSIAYYLRNYLDLYVPKVKKQTTIFIAGVAKQGFTYRPIIEYDDVIDDNKFTTTLCRDMSFSKPTLRQVITALMLQVGRLPKVNGYTLSFIDFYAEPTIFTVDNTINYIDKSIASDSYINTIINDGNNILDSNNEIINEMVGFRDTDNPTLKAEENLYLLTRLPIYDIKKVDIYIPTKGILYRMINYVVGDIVINATPDINTGEVSVTITKPKYAFGKAHTFMMGAIKLLIDGQLFNIVDSLNINDSNPSFTFTRTSSTTITTNVWIQIYIADYNEYDQNGNILYSNEKQFYLYGYPTIEKAYQFEWYKKDITQLFVEKAKRSLLDTNFVAMENVSSISQLAQYYYGTVQYSIGGKVISGFSDKYSKAVGWWNESYTYLDNMIAKILAIDINGDLYANQLFYDDSFGLNLFYEIGKNVNYIGTRSRYDYYNDTSATRNSTTVMFGISYKPINSLKLSFTKQNKDIPLAIEQLDTSENGLSEMDDLANNEQEKINRLGNEILPIHQVCKTYAEIRPLNSILDNKYIIFKREIQVYENYYEVNYYASKSYVMKNYFTSIQTKYRAYEYVDYGSTIIRKENKKVFVLIDEYWINGDSEVRMDKYNGYFGNSSGISKMLLVSALLVSYEDNKYNLKYAIETNATNTIRIKNDLSFVAYNDTLALSYQAFDSVSGGISLYDSKGKDYDALIGLPQQWVIWTDYNDRHYLSFVGDIGMEDYIYQRNFTDLHAVLSSIPKVNNFYNPLSETERNPQFFLNNVNSATRNYYKDNAEVINQTLQFEFYTNSSNIKWNNNISELCRLKKQTYNEDGWFKAAIPHATNVLEKEQYQSYIETQFIFYSGIVYSTNNADVGKNIFVDWQTFEESGAIGNIEIVLLKPKAAPISGGYQLFDIIPIAMFLGGVSNFYVSLNDTKTELVYNSVESGEISGLTKKCKHNSANREIEDV